MLVVGRGVVKSENIAGCDSCMFKQQSATPLSLSLIYEEHHLNWLKEVELIHLLSQC